MQPRPGKPVPPLHGDPRPKKPFVKGTPKIVVDPKIKDDTMLRKMPITQKQLGQIKKYYGM
jgi:hypothetical protein